MINKKYTPVALSLGGNQGDVPANFAKAFNELELAGMKKIRLSSMYRTEPVDCPPGLDDFINAALKGSWPYSLKELFSTCKKIEKMAGREFDGSGQVKSRPLDLDIILFGNMMYSDATITVPHKNAARRLFVLIPLSEIASDWIFPDLKLKVSEILDAFRNSPEYGKIMAKKDDNTGKPLVSDAYYCL